MLRPATMILAVGLASLWPAAAWAQQRLVTPRLTLLSESIIRRPDSDDHFVGADRQVETLVVRHVVARDVQRRGDGKSQLSARSMRGNGVSGTMHYERTSPQERLVSRALFRRPSDPPPQRLGQVAAAAGRVRAVAGRAAFPDRGLVGQADGLSRGDVVASADRGARRLPAAVASVASRFFPAAARSRRRPTAWRANC